jgi:DMSO/TMAO reductase YedYZ molybdopterin-dependent catalytic subunit
MVSNTARGFLVGLGGGVLALAVSYTLRIFLGGVFLPELAAQTLFTLTPGAIESQAVESLQSLAKYSAFTGALVINLVLYGVFGALLYRSKSLSQQGGRLERFVSFTLMPYIILATIGVLLLFTTAIQSSPVSLPMLLISLVPPQLAFGVTLISFNSVGPVKPTELCEVAKPPKGKKKFDRRRRLFIQAGVASAVGAAILVYGIGFLLKPASPTGTTPATPSSLFAQDVTANGNFYRVDVNIFPPTVDGSTWQLQVSGLVNTPLTLTLDQIQNMSFYDQYNTLECVSNTIGGDLISTAQWRGVRLKDVLNQADLQPSADYIVFKAVDGYDVAIPLERAMLDGTLLAFEMNGEPLPTEHGYPLRAIVPGLYGMMNAKWITSIEAVSGTYQGYWQVRGWTNDAMYQTGSEIAIPGDAQVTQRFGINGSSEVPFGTIPIAGIAYAGDRGVSKVEVSTDGGDTWMQASTSQPLSSYTWVFWSAQWNPPAKGSYKLTVRATDGTGAVQTAVVTNPFPDGATGYHVVDISVVDSQATSSS